MEKEYIKHHDIIYKNNIVVSQHCADCMMFLVFIRHPKHKRIHFDEMNFF